MIVGGLAMLLLLREFQGIWLAAIGWFLAMAASGSLSQFKLRKRLDGFRAEDLMATGIETVPPRISLETLATEHVLQSRQEIYFVQQDGDIVGMISFRAASRVPRNRWTYTTVEEAMMPVEKNTRCPAGYRCPGGPGTHRTESVPPGAGNEGRTAPGLPQSEGRHAQPGPPGSP